MKPLPNSRNASPNPTTAPAGSGWQMGNNALNRAMKTVMFEKFRDEKMNKGKTLPVTIADTNGASPYSEKWSLHPGEALRLKRGLSAKEQQTRAKHPVVLSQNIFETPSLRKKAFFADKNCMIFCGEVREVLRWLNEAGVFADSVITSPPFYGQRDYGVAGQIGLEQKPQEFPP